MISFSVNMVTAEEKGKVKVLTSARARQDGAVDPVRQVTLEQVHGEAPHVLKSHIMVGESSKAKPRVTMRILLNKWQRQLEKERYQKRRHEDERRRAEEETRRRDLEQYTREQERVSYGPPWAHYLGGYQDRLLGGPLGLPGLRYMAPEGMEHKDCRGEVLN
jgi:hypothetical protein